MLQQFGLAVRNSRGMLWRHASSLWALQNRQRMHLIAHMSQVQGLMPLLMKKRNGHCLSARDRRRLRNRLRRLGSLSRYMVLLLAPGGFLVLPALAWWLDRRRLKRGANKPPSTAGA